MPAQLSAARYGHNSHTRLVSGIWLITAADHFCRLCCRRKLLLKAVAGSRWVPGLSSLAEFAFSMIEGMQSYYTYVEA